MDKVYVVGHKKPDTDSVTSAICLSYLKNKLGFNTTVTEYIGEFDIILNSFSYNLYYFY